MRTIETLLQIVRTNAMKGTFKAFDYEESQLLRGHYMKECELSLSKFVGDIFNFNGTKIASGYERIVVGDYGAYIEINPNDMFKDNIQTKPSERYRSSPRYINNVKYLWLETKDSLHTKIYFQKRTVKYADYKPNMCYISPNDVTTYVRTDLHANLRV